MPIVIWKIIVDPSEKNRSHILSKTFMCTTLANRVKNQCKLISDSSEM